MTRKRRGGPAIVAARKRLLPVRLGKQSRERVRAGSRPFGLTVSALLASASPRDTRNRVITVNHSRRPFVQLFFSR